MGMVVVVEAAAGGRDGRYQDAALERNYRFTL